MKKAAWYLVFTLVVLFMTAAVFIYLAPHLGWRVNAVLSGSMEPELKVGALVVTRPVEPDAIEVGDIITFRPTTVGENLITHRVVGVWVSSPPYFETKGDANDSPDPFTVPARNLVGKICLHVPYWGYFTEFLKTPFGFLFAVVIPGLIIIVAYVMSVWRAIAAMRRERAYKVVRE
ncbi:signal peptidase I [Chloroflexota bacterium]